MWRTTEHSTMRSSKNCIIFVLLVVCACVPQVVAQADAPRSLPEKDAALVHRVGPVYPDDARQAKVQGNVTLHVIVGPDGSVKSLKVLSGPSSLAPAAAAAVRQWRYKPYLINGKPVEVETIV